MFDIFDLWHAETHVYLGSWDAQDSHFDYVLHLSESFTAHTHTHTHTHTRTHLSVCLCEGLPAMFSTLRLLVSVPEDDNRCCTWQGRQTH